MKTLAVFLPYVQPYVLACPKPVMRQAIVDAAIDFCEQTHIIQQILDPLSLEAGTREYELSMPSRQELVMVKRAWFKGTELAPAAQESVSLASAWRDDIPGVTATTGDPGEFYQVGQRSIGLHPVPAEDEDEVLTARVALKPTRNATSLEDVLYEDWVEAIRDGALYRLHTTPGQSYTDLPAAANRFAGFMQAVSKAKAQATRGRVQADTTVQMRPFA